MFNLNFSNPLGLSEGLHVFGARRRIHETAEDGRYSLFEPGDFFADRDVRSVEKIELVK
jgi:hypothetical protein